jgi:hypothetical protein
MKLRREVQEEARRTRRSTRAAAESSDARDWIAWAPLVPDWAGETNQ